MAEISEVLDTRISSIIQAERIESSSRYTSRTLSESFLWIENFDLSPRNTKKI